MLKPFAKSHKFGNVEFRIGLGILAVAHKMPVHPKVETRLRAADVDNHLLAFPFFVDINPFAVAAHGVAFHGHFRQLAVVEVVGGVHIHGHAVAVQLPVARHGNGAPIAVVEVCTEEIGGTFIGVGHIVELPRAVKFYIR